ncbi:MAG: hypothetical protein HY318_15575 [Armatimonadetes bacterium]|nr:hypothetical protein [Armatimonadota bacterium]
MNKVCRYKFLVIDDEHLLEIDNLQRKVNQAEKHPEPVMRLDAPWDKPDECFNYLNVLYDDQDKVFKMWYSVLSRGDEWFANGRFLAYATSRDGIHWERPILNRIECNGSTENNYLTHNMQGFCGSIIIDPSDIPSRRYKMLFMVSSYGTGDAMDWAKFHVPVCLAYSEDGLTWDRPTHVNPVVRGLSDGGFVFYYDPDRRKYVLVTRRVPNLPRDVSQYESHDLIHWEDKGRILVPGDELDPPSLFNFQAFAPFIYEDLYLGMLDVQYSLPGAETYEVYHKPPLDFPDQRMGVVEFQLAYSRDGQRWLRPNDRSPVVPVGDPNSPDAGIIFAPLSSPFVVNGETYLYYTASRPRHSVWDYNKKIEECKSDMRGLCCGMLAKMPEDHWVSLDAGSEGGSFTAKPWGPPHEVFINADIEEGGSIELELVTPYGSPMPGYSRQECIPVTRGGKSMEIKWKNGRHPWDFADEQKGGILPRFHLRNAKLYSYSFTLPDPDGQLERNRLNSRWLECIKHRSDNWDRNSNEPAIGLPPFSGR